MQLASAYESFRVAGAALWAISPQAQGVNLALRRRRNLPFPILADATQAVIRAWGIANDLDPKGRSIPYPATYLVNKEGSVGWCRLSLTTRDRPTIAEILAALPERK